MDPIEALRQIQGYLQSAADSTDLNAVQRHIGRARAILTKALPHPEAKRASAPYVSPVAKILNEPRLGFVAEQRLDRKKQAR
jgi:hypothetical protein